MDNSIRIKTSIDAILNSEPVEDVSENILYKLHRTTRRGALRGAALGGGLGALTGGAIGASGAGYKKKGRKKLSIKDRAKRALKGAAIGGIAGATGGAVIGGAHARKERKQLVNRWMPDAKSRRKDATKRREYRNTYNARSEKDYAERVRQRAFDDKLHKKAAEAKYNAADITIKAEQRRLKAQVERERKKEAKRWAADYDAAQQNLQRSNKHGIVPGKGFFRNMKRIRQTESLVADILNGEDVEDVVDEAAAERGVHAKGVMSQKQLHQLIVNGKARGIMTQARNFLIAGGKLGCPESTESLKHLDMALDILNDVCED